MEHLITFDLDQRKIVWKLGRDEAGIQLVQYFTKNVLNHLGVPCSLLVDLRFVRCIRAGEQNEILQLSRHCADKTLVEVAYLVDVNNFARMKRFIELKKFPGSCAVFGDEEDAMKHLDEGLIANEVESITQASLKLWHSTRN